MVLENKTTTFLFFFLNNTENHLNQYDKGKGQMSHFYPVSKKASEVVPLTKNTCIRVFSITWQFYLSISIITYFTKCRFKGTFMDVDVTWKEIFHNKEPRWKNKS